ncbi:MAG: radical SAM protein [Deltaproteobacteria bacterium]|nr:radical SAM protein [Deltaproteobacteria bacterium]
MDKTDILLIKPGSQRELYGSLSDDSLTGIEPPLWAGLMATFLKMKGIRVEMIDVEAEKLSLTKVVERISEVNPLLVGIIVSGTNPSASTMNMVGAKTVLEEMARMGLTVKTVLAGLHPSALPRRTMEEEPTDFVCEGEGFYTLSELIEALKRDDEKGVERIRGIWYRRDGGIIGNERAPLIEDLDKELPYVSWDLLPMDRYRAHNWHCFQELGQKREPYAVIYTSLGCPYHCHFCCINAIFGKPGIRYRSPEKVVSEIDLLVSTYGVKNIKFIDEMFVLKEEHVLKICDLLIERGYPLNIWAYARINTVNERLLKKLKEAGFTWLAYGIESGNDRVLKSVTKGITVEKIKEVIKMTKSIGINVIGNFILGLPEDDFASMQDTLNLAMELNCEFINLYCATAYPGSPLYDQAIKEGWRLPETWAGYSPYSYEHLPLPTKHLKSADVLRFRDEAYVKYYSNERYQSMIREKFGKEVLDGIVRGLTKKLKRKHLGENPL